MTCEHKQLALPIDLSALERQRHNPRKLPLDFIYTFATRDATCCLAVQAGLKYGIQSAMAGSICSNVHAWGGKHEVMFVDCDYINYDHRQHLSVVAELRPRYATVRDVMSVAQCAAAGIAYYPLGQILDWAAELAQFAENVIVIPKYDCLDQIPPDYMLGYSVPTSHGGTPLPIEAFAGRRVHLLGGSWSAQLNYLYTLGDDVVSVDNNYIERISRYGVFVYPDGRYGTLSESLGLHQLVNRRYVAFAISAGNIAAKVNELYESAGVTVTVRSTQTA